MAAPRTASYAAQDAPPTVAPVAPDRQPTAGPELEPAEHNAAVLEHGAFARAVCTTCDWRGPARRARAFATADIEEHRLLGGAPQSIDVREAR